MYPEIQLDMVFSAQLPKKIQATQRASPSVRLPVRLDRSCCAPFCKSGMGESMNMTAAMTGNAAKNSVRYIQF